MFDIILNSLGLNSLGLDIQLLAVIVGFIMLPKFFSFVATH